jgi:hypothetical protein
MEKKKSELLDSLPARFPQFKENEYFSTKSLNASHLSQV